MRSSPTFNAIDLEFIKCRGAHFCRAIAFVPFRAALLPRTRSSPSPSPSPSGTGRETRTCFSDAPTVLSLSPGEVMQTADVLPCGHVLVPLLMEKMPQGDTLAETKSDFHREAAETLSAYRAVRQSIREYNKAVRMAQQQARPSRLEEREPTPNEEEEDEAKKLGSSGSGSGGGSTRTTGKSSDGLGNSDRDGTQSAHDNALSPQEQLLRKELQIREALTKHFDLLDPYSIPNVRRLTNLRCLQQLYDSDTESSEFGSAVSYLAPLRAYGKGKGGRRALSFLLRYHPTFAQALLRRSFTSGRDFTQFLETCAAATEATLREAQQVHQSGSYPFLLTDPEAGGNGRPPLRYVECDTLDALSVAINETWSGLLYKQNVRKFFAYGNADARVLHSTLGLSCGRLAQEKGFFSARAAAAGGGGGPSRAGQGVGGGGGRPQGRALPVSPVPQDLLLSPYQARVVDLTTHPLFAAAGFMPQERRVPSLGVALRRAARHDATAARVLEVQRPHDPLWDAQSLACVCVGSGVVR